MSTPPPPPPSVDVAFLRYQVAKLSHELKLEREIARRRLGVSKAAHAVVTAWFHADRIMLREECPELAAAIRTLMRAF